MRSSHQILVVMLLIIIAIQTGWSGSKSIGAITYIKGNGVEIYSTDQSERKPAKLKDAVFENTIIRTPAGTKVEITWNKDFTVSTVAANQTVNIAELYRKAAGKSRNAIDNLLAGLDKLLTGDENSGSSGNVAAVRGDEKAAETLHWKTSETDLKQALKLFDEKKYKDCIEKLDQYLKENYEFNQAAIALLTKGMAHYHLDQKDKAKKALELFLKDFPRHTLAGDAKKALKELD